jgi:hypothetical protein
MPCATGAEQIRRAIAVRARVGYLQREVECKVKFDSFVDPSQRALPNLSMRRGSNLKALAPGNLDFGTARDEASKGIHRRYLRQAMSQELVLTVINETFEFNSVRNEFEGWLKDSGASGVTVRSYLAAVQKWLKILALHPRVRPAVVWQRSTFCSGETRRSVAVREKTGERELPLSPKTIRRLQFLYLRGSSTPWTGNREQKLSAGVLYCLFKAAAEKIG